MSLKQLHSRSTNIDIGIAKLEKDTLPVGAIDSAVAARTAPQATRVGIFTRFSKALGHHLKLALAVAYIVPTTTFILAFLIHQYIFDGEDELA